MSIQKKIKDLYALSNIESMDGLAQKYSFGQNVVYYICKYHTFSNFFLFYYPTDFDRGTKNQNVRRKRIPSTLIRLQQILWCGSGSGPAKNIIRLRDTALNPLGDKKKDTPMQCLFTTT